MKKLVLLTLIAAAVAVAADPATESFLVWGTVDDGCQLITGATVSWRCETCNESWGESVTNDEGTYRIAGNPTPNHLYHHVIGTASAAGYKTATIEFTSWQGCPYLVRFTLTPENADVGKSP